MSDHPFAERLYRLATGEDEARLCRDIPESQCNEQPYNFVLQTLSQALAKTGDALANAKVVLPWLLGSVGAPVYLIAFLVPIRESLALLPQILVGGFLRRCAIRKGFWAWGSVVEGLCVLAMAFVGLSGMTGALAGWLIVGLLTLFSLARGVASIAAKDVMGKTVSKTRRGRVSGYAETASGLMAAGVGAYLALAPAGTRPDWLLYALLIGAGVIWFLAAITYGRLAEHPGATEGGKDLRHLFADQIHTLLKDRELQRFLVARTFMISTALMSPLFVGLAQQKLDHGLGSLGWLMLAAGLAGAVSASFWGWFSDFSSRATMALAAAGVGVAGLAALAVLHFLPSLAETIWFYAAILFVLGIGHAGVRIGRKTHIVDLAGKDHKAEYVALSNTIIGVLLLVVGAFSGATMAYGLSVGVSSLSILALIGSAIAFGLRNVQE